MLLATILAISLACPLTLPQCLLVIVYHLCSTLSLLPSLAATASQQQYNEGAERQWANNGRAQLLKLQKVDCHWGEVLTESRLWLQGAIMSVSDHTLDVLLDHLWDYDLTMILVRLADRSPGALIIIIIIIIIIISSANNTSATLTIISAARWLEICLSADTPA